VMVTGNVDVTVKIHMYTNQNAHLFGTQNQKSGMLLEITLEKVIDKAPLLQYNKYCYIMKCTVMLCRL